MIEMTEQQIQALEVPEAAPPRTRQSPHQGNIRLTPR